MLYAAGIVFWILFPFTYLAINQFNNLESLFYCDNSCNSDDKIRSCPLFKSNTAST